MLTHVIKISEFENDLIEDGGDLTVRLSQTQQLTERDKVHFVVNTFDGQMHCILFTLIEIGGKELANEFTIPIISKCEKIQNAHILTIQHNLLNDGMKTFAFGIEDVLEIEVKVELTPKLVLQSMILGVPIRVSDKFFLENS